MSSVPLTVPPPLRRWLLAFAGGLAGFLLYALGEASDADRVSDRTLIILIAGLLGFFGAHLAMSGPLGMRSAAVRAGGLGLGLSALSWLVLRRYDVPWDLGHSPYGFLSLLAVAVLPVPFLISGAGGRSWRDYPTLFRESWSLMVRGAVAVIFTLVVWLVVFLSDALLGIVGVTFLGDLLTEEAGPFVLTGAAFGLAVAVVDELAHRLSPDLVLRLVRLLLPVLVAVAAVFLAALAFRGFGQAFGGVSAAATLLGMALVGTTLIAVVADASDETATESPVLRHSARAMALMLPVLAALALWAVWLRVGQYGWTPGRLFLAVGAGIGLVYGLAYAAAILRGNGWRGGVRAANPWIALVLIGAAILWLTPLFNAEAISARDQKVRFLDGRTPLAALDVWEIGTWGIAGAAVLAELREKATAEGDTALLASLDGQRQPPGLPDLDAQRADLRAILPVQPVTATGTRDSLISLMESWQIEQIARACGTALDGGTPGCVMVVADLVPGLPGEEAIVAMAEDGWVRLTGYYVQDGFVAERSVTNGSGMAADGDAGFALLRSWQAAPPPLAPVPIFQLGTGPGGVFFLP